MKFPTVAAGALASALLLWASAPPVGAASLAWFALVPVAAAALVTDGRARRVAVPLAYALYLELLLVPAFPFGIANRQWGDPVLPIMVADSPVVFVALVAVPVVGLALCALRFPDPVGARSGVAAIVVPAIMWTALDLLRTRFDPAGLFGPLFLSQHDAAGGRLAALGGPWLVTSALVAFNYAFALVLVRRRAALVRGAGAAGVVLALVAAASAFRATGRADRIAVAVVQPGYDTAEFERPVLHYLRRATRNLARASLDLIADLAPLTRAAAANGAELVVWPEATVWVDPRENSRVRAELGRLAADTNGAIVVPYFIRSRAEGATVVVLPDGSVLGPQPKQRPMWFLGEEGGNRTPPRPVPTALGRVGTLLGVDNQDPATPRRLAASGADLLASSTHDWRELAAYQLAFTQLHARALGRALARSDWRYRSAIYDAGGARRASAGADKRRTVVVARVAPASGETPYVRIGDVYGWLCVAAAIALGAAGVARRRASAG